MCELNNIMLKKSISEKNMFTINIERYLIPLAGWNTPFPLWLSLLF